MAEWYKGFDPRGQFYNNKVDYYGLGVSLGFCASLLLFFASFVSILGNKCSAFKTFIS